jgi:hypothetical protein
MPYIIKKEGEKGFKVCKRDQPNVCFSKKPIPKKRAIKQLKAIGMSGRMKGGSEDKLKMFELFKGTGSIGKVAKKMGFEVVSLDFDPIYTPDIETDILKWDYKKWAKDNNFYPNYIWASPPCNTYSPLAYPLKERNTQTAKPLSGRAKIGTQILFRTLEIIDYFKKKNPKLLFTIENPRGMMRKHKEMQKLPNLETTLYCLYGDFKRKPTDFWSNFRMDLLTSKSYCKNKTIGVVDLKKIEDRYSIPSKLVKQILSVAKEKILNNENGLKGGYNPNENYIGAEGFEDYLKQVEKEQGIDFNKLGSVRNVKGNIFESIVLPTDRIVKDEVLYNKILSEYLTEAEFNKLKAERPNMSQTYSQYMDSARKIAEARSTRNLDLEERSRQDRGLFDYKRALYDWYLKEYPERAYVKCRLDEEGNLKENQPPFSTTRQECQRRVDKFKRSQQCSGFFGKATCFLSDVADFIVDNVADKLPVVGQIASSVYKSFAPPTSKFYGSGILPTNKKLYEQVKKKVYKEQPRHSLYRSARVIKEYKALNGSFKETNPNPLNIKKWFMQEWLDVESFINGLEKPCGSVKSNKYPLCRPKAILEKMSEEELNKMLDEKQKLKEKPLRTEKILGRSDLNIKPTITGLGKMNFKTYLKDVQKVSPIKYLRIVKENALENGYDPSKIKWANDGKHKLEYEGVKFGAMKYNDYILYQIKEGKEKALKMRTNYRKRAEKVMEETYNHLSPASLSFYVLW